MQAAATKAVACIFFGFPGIFEVQAIGSCGKIINVEGSACIFTVPENFNVQV